MRRKIAAALGLVLGCWVAADFPAPVEACSLPIVRLLHVEVQGLPSGVRLQENTHQPRSGSEPFQIVVTNDSQASVRVVERNQILVDVAPGSSGSLPVTGGPHYMRLEQGNGQWPIDLSYEDVVDPHGCDAFHASEAAKAEAWAEAIAPGLEGDARWQAIDAHMERQKLEAEARRQAVQAQQQRELVQLRLKAAVGIALAALLVGRRLARRPTIG